MLRHKPKIKNMQEDDTVAYDTSSVSDDYYSDSDSIW